MGGIAMNNEPKELAAPYIKQRSRRRNGVGRFALLILTVLCITALSAIYLNRGDERMAFIFRGKGTRSAESTAETVQTSVTASKAQGYDGASMADLSAASRGERYENKSDYELYSGFSASLASIKGGSVLFIATRGYEGYAESKSGVSYDEKNTAALASLMATEMQRCGISASFFNVCPDGDYSYENAYKKLTDYLDKHDEVKYIIDISREALCGSDGELLRPAVELDGQIYAQLRLAVGTDAGGGAHPGWRTRLMQADAVFDMISDKYPHLIMPTLVSRARLNQHLPRCTLTLRIGSLGNSFSEAENTARLFAQAFSSAVK